MPTLGEACQQLRIGRVTLEKWIDRLHIEKTRHEWDWRFTVIAPEDVERISEARRKLPQSARSAITGAFIPTVSTLAFDRRPARDETANDVSPTVRATPRQRPLQRDSFTGLPEGMMSRTDVAAAHGLALTTLRRWCDDGRIDCDPGVYALAHGRFSIARPITRRGLAQLYQLASHRPDFTRCPGCPHDEAERLAE